MGKQGNYQRLVYSPYVDVDLCIYLIMVLGSILLITVLMVIEKILRFSSIRPICNCIYGQHTVFVCITFSVGGEGGFLGCIGS